MVRNAILIVLLTGLILAVSDLFIVFVSLLLLLFAGFLFGVFLQSLSHWVSNHIHLSYRVSFALVALCFVIASGGLLYYLGAQMAAQLTELGTQLSQAASNAQAKLQENKQFSALLPDLSQVQQSAAQSGSALISPLMRGVNWFIWGLTGLLVIFFVGMYSAGDPKLYRDGLIKLFPKPARGRVHEILNRLYDVLQRWLVGRMFSMTLTGILTGIGLWVLGVPLAGTLALLAAILTFIPNIGPLIAAIPQVLLALNVGTDTALYVVGYCIFLETLESYIVTPLVERHEVSLPPILTIAAQLLMGVAFGVVGVMMAAPLVVVSMVIVQAIYIRDTLGEEHPGSLVSS